MISVNELVMNQKAIAEIAAIKTNVILSFQVLLIITLLDQGVFPTVNLSIKNDSSFSGEIVLCSGHSFLISNPNGFIGNVAFTDINFLEVLKGA